MGFIVNAASKMPPQSLEKPEPMATMIRTPSWPRTTSLPGDQVYSIETYQVEKDGTTMLVTTETWYYQPAEWSTGTIPTVETSTDPGTAIMPLSTGNSSLPGSNSTDYEYKSTSDDQSYSSNNSDLSGLNYFAVGMGVGGAVFVIALGFWCWRCLRWKEPVNKRRFDAPRAPYLPRRPPDGTIFGAGAPRSSVAEQWEEWQAAELERLDAHEQPVPGLADREGELPSYSDAPMTGISVERGPEVEDIMAGMGSGLTTPPVPDQPPPVYTVLRD